MMKREIQGITLECRQGDIARQSDMQAIVNAANAQLRMGGGVAGAIHRAAGPGLEEECRPLAPIRPGQAVITGGHDLPNDYVIHCLGPVYQVDEPSPELLASCYQNALRLAEDNHVRSLAFPSISTGAFGYPMESAAKVAFGTVMDALPRLSSVKHIRFVLFSEGDVTLHAEVVEHLVGLR
ncbi:macro domain-containing protein [Halopseudomonas sp.]|uniref:macro domain-containing protein n=1 Tax=Halopseudomonas sp. TaxID=2901191 RepID=UPI00356A9D4D